ncbi:MAG: porin family protein [Bacteroidota bacterium]
MLLVSSGAISAQRNPAPQNLPKYDKQKIHFGFVLGINRANFKMQEAGDFKYQDSIYSITPTAQAGLNLGILSNLRLGEYFDLRFMPALSFVQRKLDYGFYIPSTSQSSDLIKTVESTYLELPVNIKFKSKRIDNYRIYVVGGGRYSTDMISQAKVKERDPDILKLRRKDYGLELGVGADFYMPYFKFSPEIKMFSGMPDLLVRENTPYVNSIQSLKSKIFFISFFFE